jgi:hypothetical protein
MFWERTGIICNQIVVIVGVEMAQEAQVFVEDLRTWLPQAKELCKKFHQNNFT